MFCGALGGPGSPCLQPRPLCGATCSSQQTCAASSPATQACLKLLTAPSPSCHCLRTESAHPPSRSVNVLQNSCFGFKTQLKYFLWDSPSFFLLAWHHAGASAWALGPHPTPGPGSRLLGKPVLNSPGSCCPPELGSLLLVRFTGGSDRNPLKA